MDVKDTISIVTGRVRDEARALDVLGSLAGMRATGLVDSIIVSTWQGELERAPELLRFILREDIIVIQAPEQRASIQESHQKIPLLAALNFVDERSYVTRHRFDRVHPNEVFAGHMAHVKRTPPQATTRSGGPLKHRVTVNSALVDVPFFFSDLIFSGFRDDICALAEINAHAELLRWPGVNAEMTFFATPFYRWYPEVGDYLSTYPGLCYGYDDLTRALKDAQRNSEFFVQMFALYVHLAVTCFQIGYRANQPQRPVGPVNLDELIFSGNKSSDFPGLFYFPLAGHMATKRGALFDEIANGNVLRSEFSEQVLAGIASFRASERAPTPLRLPLLGPAARQYAETMTKCGISGIPFFGSTSGKPNMIDYYLGQFSDVTQSLNRNNGSLAMGEWGTL